MGCDGPCFQCARRGAALCDSSSGWELPCSSERMAQWDDQTIAFVSASPRVADGVFSYIRKVHAGVLVKCPPQLVCSPGATWRWWSLERGLPVVVGLKELVKSKPFALTSTSWLGNECFCSAPYSGPVTRPQPQSNGTNGLWKEMSSKPASSHTCLLFFSLLRQYFSV